MYIAIEYSAKAHFRNDRDENALGSAIPIISVLGVLGALLGPGREVFCHLHGPAIPPQTLDPGAGDPLGALLGGLRGGTPKGPKPQILTSFLPCFFTFFGLKSKAYFGGYDLGEIMRKFGIWEYAYLII